MDQNTIDFTTELNMSNYPKVIIVHKQFDSPSKTSSKDFIYLTKVGFENLGNTCYLNTSLQCLLHTKVFTAEFLRSFTSDNETSMISKELYGMIREIVKIPENEAYKPSKFITEFSNKHVKFKGFVQHDSQEFLRILLEDISNDLNRVKHVPIYKELHIRNKNKVVANKAFHELFLERENSIIIEIFYGQVCNIFACELCNHMTYSFEKIMDIPILLGNTYNLTIKKKLGFTICSNCLIYTFKMTSFSGIRNARVDFAISGEITLKAVDYRFYLKYSSLHFKGTTTGRKGRTHRK